VGIFAKTAGKEFVPDVQLEDHWLNCQDDYEVRIRDYCRMGLTMAEKVLKIQIPYSVVQRDTPDILDPLYNIDKIYERPVVNAEVDKSKNDDIMHRARHIIDLTQRWIRKPFPLDPLPGTPALQAPARPETGKGKKVTIPSFQTPAPVPPGSVYGHDRTVVYFKEKKKRKRNEEQATEATPSAEPAQTVDASGLVPPPVDTTVQSSQEGESSAAVPPSTDAAAPSHAPLVMHPPRIKKRRLKKKHRAPSIPETIPEGMEEEEEDPEDNVPLGQRMRSATVEGSGAERIDISSSPMVPE
jgi:hypothetical protein